ncbi:MAG: MOSC N-terminal beta barrel domain-containing protein [Bryobacteraceae bacterium]
MYLAEIWRYPVKSMAGERLESARLTHNGIEGDRIVQVYDARGNIATSRTYPDLLGMHAALGEDGVPLVDGRRWDDPAVLAAVRSVVGPGARLIYDASSERFDILPLLVATDGAVQAFGRDVRRLRPNLVIGGVEGLAERQWQGRRLSIGKVSIGIHDLRGRCVMTTFDPDTLAQDREVLRDIVKRFGGKLALNCEVLKGGSIETGPKVELHPAA